uniref:Ammonium transporter n=1 Tax=Tetradesmus obliquus TaxID=3088 RepID=A0A383V2C3_TETOB|eukprot:jgi/Sobl393_1/12678/SZX59718.1
MGLLDNASPAVSKGIVVSVLLGMTAIFVAMCVTVPTGPITGVDADLSAINSGDCAWMLISAAIVLLMTPGVCFFYCGMGHHKNVVSTIMQALLPLAIIPIVWATVGFGLAFGDSVNGSYGIFGSPVKYGLLHNVGAVPEPAFAGTIPLSLFAVFQCAFAIITPALLIGSVADRVNVSSLCIFIGLWHVLVYCPLAHMVWHPTGLIRMFGVIDFAGGTVVHMSSGYAALIAALYLGPSRSAAAHSDMFEMKEPANVPYVVLGTALLFFGWFGFNAGSALAAGTLTALAFINTLAAAASAMLAWVLLDNLRGHKLRATGVCVGLVVGLIAITPAAGFVNTGAAFLIGVIGAVCCSGAQELMERYGNRFITDTSEVFVCHGVSGTVGMICTALFATTSVNEYAIDGAFYGNGIHLGKTLAVLCVLVPWVSIFTWGCLWVTDKVMSLRVSDEELLAGLDVSKHGERAMAIDVLKVHVDALNASSKAGTPASGSDAA